MSLILSSDLQQLKAGIHLTVTASDLVETGLALVSFAAASLASDPLITASAATVQIPDQRFFPGSIRISTWHPVGPGDNTPNPATTFNTAVQWLALGR